jgi:hypothetical protein
MEPLYYVTKDYVSKGWMKLVNGEFYDFRKLSLVGSDGGECGDSRRGENVKCINFFSGWGRVEEKGPLERCLASGGCIILQHA